MAVISKSTGRDVNVGRSGGVWEERREMKESEVRERERERDERDERDESLSENKAS